MNPLLAAPDFDVWDKPTGMSTHNEAPSLLEMIQAQHSRPAHFLNRLDAETSGLVITIRSSDKVKAYQKLWQSESTQKIYVGLHRRPQDFTPEARVWDWALTDKSEGRKNPQGLSKDRVPCWTKMCPLLESRHLIFSAMILETGRQHQIRKHAAIAKCELVGDSRYGDPKYNQNLAKHVADLRLGLHAAALIWAPRGTTQVLQSPLPPFFESNLPGATTRWTEFLASRSSGPTEVERSVSGLYRLKKWDHS
ncbi:MAG: pseudouridine synthase family protein [Bdellovibrio sp.]